MRNWIKKFFVLYDIKDLIIGGHCGCCGNWIPDEIFPEAWSWGLCQECIADTPLNNKEDKDG